MPDVDDDFDRRNRDKFARDRGSMRSDGDRHRYSTGSVGIKRGPVRRDDEPNFKRSRFENAADSYDPQFTSKSESGPRAMLTFKKFLETQDDSLSDQDAIAKYNDYKFEYRKNELEKFFQAHKEEEWFQLKYHPDHLKETNERNNEKFKKRLEVYAELTQPGGLGHELALDFENTEAIIRFMDAVVVKLEGGTDEDVQLVLKEPIVDEALDDLRKKQAAKSNGSSNGGSESTAANGAVKTEAPAEETEEMATLLKRVPFKTHSIFFRNIGPTQKIEDIETECKNYPGYLRIGLSDPINDQNFTRRLWVSFRRDVRIKDIFWNMKNAKFAEGDSQASVNRDLRRRVRTVNGIANHRQVVQNDIRQAARLVALFDYKRKLYAAEEEEDAAPPKDLDAIVGKSKNPVLEGVFEYFVEETNAEEEELLGVSVKAGEDLKLPLEVDKNLNAYLDKLLVYLRVVHSIDYYNHCEYANEDSMPNRMGMVHVRDLPLSDEFGKSEAGVPLVPKKNIDMFISNCDERLKASILKFEVISEDDLSRLGKKDLDKAVEDFIEANCVEVQKDKWLCPLSGKKFKGPEFIRKHLQSKHEQKLDEARAEAAYFNNYIADPERPHNPEPKPAASTSVFSTPEDSRRPPDERFSGGHRGAPWSDRPRFSGPPRRDFGGRDFGGRDFGGRGGGDPGARGRWPDDFGTGRRDPRQPASYRDLDAPEDVA